jgi:hypothetical protein
MKNILVTNFNNTGEDVCVINTTLTAEQLQKALTIKKQAFIEVYEVPGKDLQYYIYDPLFADKKFDNNVLNILK